MLIKKIGQLIKNGGIKIVTAESCTGGLVSAFITSVPGSSKIFDHGFIVYSNEAKHKLLNIPTELINKHGAVSEEVARAMSTGALTNSDANLSIAVTGIAGPDGGSNTKPVGLVYISSTSKQLETTIVKKYDFTGNRDMIRQQSTSAAILLLLTMAENIKNRGNYENQ